jgi:predicted glycosyl hydrolase (DUF1957 family)
MARLLCESLQDAQIWSEFGSILKNETKLSKKELLRIGKENTSKQTKPLTEYNQLRDETSR